MGDRTLGLDFPQPRGTKRQRQKTNKATLLLSQIFLTDTYHK